MSSKRYVLVGNVKIGGGAPVVIQTMTKTDARDVEATLAQIQEAYEYGTEVVRVAVPDMESADALGKILKRSPVPIIADVHFDPRIALRVLELGVHGLRLNPGNISDPSWLRKIVASAKRRGVPIRVGANSGSLPRDLREKVRSGDMSMPEALVKAAMRQVKLLESLDFHDIKISVKSSEPELTIEAYRLLSRITDYPLHIGVTEAGPLLIGTVKSSYALGTLLKEGIGDTIRVSLTGPLKEEVEVARTILSSLGLREDVQVTSCPTCGRLQMSHEGFFKLVEMVKEELLRGLKWKRLKVAIMGCVVNGPGEASDADLAVMIGKGYALLYLDGEPKERIRLNGKDDPHLISSKVFELLEKMKDIRK